MHGWQPLPKRRGMTTMLTMAVMKKIWIKIN